MWKPLDHPNVLPLLGVIMSEIQFTMVSKWMPNGNINEFVKKCPDANRFELVSFRSGCHHPRLSLTIA
jgi:serine/threonine protein kinase